MTSPKLSPAEAAAPATTSPPSNPSSTTPAMAKAHPAHVTAPTRSPERLTNTGVNAIEACVRNETLVASVKSKATLHAPCATRFHSANSPAARQNAPLDPSRLLASAFSGSVLARSAASLFSRMIMGTKHSAAKTPRTAPMTPALGGPGMP